MEGELCNALLAARINVVDMGPGRFGLKIHKPMYRDPVIIWRLIDYWRPAGVFCAGYMIVP